jgi:hypothetical protein
LCTRQTFNYNNGPGSPVAAAQGKRYLQEFVARFTGQYPQATSALKKTFVNDSTYFPLSQPIYADNSAMLFGDCRFRAGRALLVKLVIVIAQSA